MMDIQRLKTLSGIAENNLYPGVNTYQVVHLMNKFVSELKRTDPSSIAEVILKYEAELDDLLRDANSTKIMSVADKALADYEKQMHHLRK
jgi:hypothetical protein